MSLLVMRARHAALRWRLLGHMGWRAGWQDGRRAWHHVDQTELDGGFGCLGGLTIFAYCIAGFLVWTRDGLFGLSWRGIHELVTVHFCGAFGIWLAGLFGVVYLVAGIIWVAVTLGHLPANLSNLLGAQRRRARLAAFIYVRLVEAFGAWLNGPEIEALYRDLLPALDADAVDALACAAPAEVRSRAVEFAAPAMLRRALLLTWPELLIDRLSAPASAAISACVAGDAELRRKLAALALDRDWFAPGLSARSLARLLDRLPAEDVAALLDAFAARPCVGQHLGRLMAAAERERINLRPYAAWLEWAPIPAVEAINAWFRNPCATEPLA